MPAFSVALGSVILVVGLTACGGSADDGGGRAEPSLAPVVDATAAPGQEEAVACGEVRNALDAVEDESLSIAQRKQRSLQYLQSGEGLFFRSGALDLSSPVATALLASRDDVSRDVDEGATQLREVLRNECADVAA